MSDQTRILNFSDVLAGAVCAVANKTLNKHSSKRIAMDGAAMVAISAIASKSQGQLSLLSQGPLKEDYVIQGLLYPVYQAVQNNESSYDSLIKNVAKGALYGWSGDMLAQQLGGDKKLL